jgi:AraC-like DNA-binding protein
MTATTIPLIRCGSIMPLVLWMQANGRPVEDSLRAVDLGFVLKGGPYLPIPLRPALAFLRNASVVEGPDLPFRVISSSSLKELGMIGRVALGGGTVRAALFRVAEALPRQVSYETIAVRSVPDGLIVRQAWGLRLEEETLHVVHLYFSALIQALCSYTGARFPVFERVVVVGHPVHGLSHLPSSFAGAVEASGDRTLELLIPSRVADSFLPDAADDDDSRFPAAPTIHQPMNVEGSLSASVKLVIAGMLLDGTPTVERVAAAGDFSVRTLQRRLREEGTTFLRLLEEVRQEIALAGLSAGRASASELAASLGYGQPSSFSRAVRRWTGSSPRALGGRSDR